MIIRVLGLVGVWTLVSGSSDASNVTNWVGLPPHPTDSACYRKTHLMKTCPTGYEYDNVATCWAQCPLDYPVECGMECIPPSADCTMEVISKVGAAAAAALKAATSGVFGNLASASKAVQTGVLCGQKLFAVVTKIVGYVEKLKFQFPDTTEDQLRYLVSKSSIIATDVPAILSACFGKSKSFTTAYVTSAGSHRFSSVIDKIVFNVAHEGRSLLTFVDFIKLMSAIDLNSVVSSLSSSDMNQLQHLIESDTTCGENVQDAIDKTVTLVTELKTNDSAISNADIRLAISRSDLFLNQIPRITTECMANASEASYNSRSSIRKALLLIVDKIIDTGDSDGTPLIVGDYILAVARLGLSVISTFDTTGLAAMAEEYIQPICGPTSFLGKIDDGNVTEALGLTTEGDAFKGSSGTWTKAGDGIAKFTFVSSDTKDVTVVVHSGGNSFAEVKVKKRKTVEWSTTIEALADKTLYLDRWRPGFLGIPGKGGGSLLSWISRSSEGGHLELTIQINVS